jgi:hypothetical protein
VRRDHHPLDGFMTDESSSASYVSCDCPQCGTRLHFPLSKAGKPGRCSMCAHVVRVPRPELRPRTAGGVSDDIYAVAPDAQRDSPSVADEPSQVAVVCPVCRLRRYMAAEWAGKRTRCKECGTPFRIPAAPVPLRIDEPPSQGMYRVGPEDPLARRAAARSSDLSLAAEHLTDEGVGSQARSQPRSGRGSSSQRTERQSAEGNLRRDAAPGPAPASPGRRELLHWDDDGDGQPDAVAARAGRRNAKHQQPDDESPPRWTFLSGVFSLPFHLDVLPRTIFFALGLAAFNLVAVYGWELSGYGSFAVGMFSTVGVGFIFLAALWLGIWAFSYGSACFLGILHETAHGAQRLADWHDPDWREWVYSLLHLAYVFTLCLLAARGAAFPLQAWLPRTDILQAVLVFVLFPILLLGTVERQSIFNPFSWLVVRTLASGWWCWGVFHLLAGGMFLALAWATSSCFAASPYAAALLMAPPWAAYAFIYARLLGRLIWRALLRVELQPAAANNARATPRPGGPQSAGDGSAGGIQRGRECAPDA